MVNILKFILIMKFLLTCEFFFNFTWKAILKLKKSNFYTGCINNNVTILFWAHQIGRSFPRIMKICFSYLFGIQLYKCITCSEQLHQDCMYVYTMQSKSLTSWWDVTLFYSLQNTWYHSCIQVISKYFWVIRISLNWKTGK